MRRLVVGSLIFLGLSVLHLFAQPAVIYTYSGTSGHYLLDFTLENTTPASQGFDLYLFGVYANGAVAGNPLGYNPSSYTKLHTLEIGDVPSWPFNDTWIDPTYKLLQPGNSLSGFEVLDTDATVPTSIQFFVFGENEGKVYAGPGNHNTHNLTNPLFIGNAVLVPEPSTFSLVVGSCLLFLFSRARLRKSALRESNGRA